MRHPRKSVALAAGLAFVLSAGAAAQTPSTERKLQLSFDHGTVTLKAQNVTPRDIMVEWARQCGCIVKDGDKTPGTMITVPIEFVAEPESAVLASILSGAAGYALGPRLEGQKGASEFGVVAIFPVSHASSMSYSSTSSVAAPLVTTPDDELPPVTPIPTVVPSAPPSTQKPTLPGQSNGVPPGRSGGPGTTLPGTTGRGGGAHE